MWDKSYKTIISVKETIYRLQPKWSDVNFMYVRQLLYFFKVYFATTFRIVYINIKNGYIRCEEHLDFT